MTTSLSRRTLLGAGVGASTVALAGCALTAHSLPSGLRMMIPNSAGSGYDQTGRAVARLLQDHRITDRVEAFNVLGAGGTVALARLLNERGNGDLLMVMGLGLVGATYAHGSAARVTGATALVRLHQEPEGVVVPAGSPYRSLSGLVRTWRANPGKVIVGGGSFPGGPDHLFAMELARTAGIAPRAVEFRSHDGGGRLLSALLGGRVDIGTSGLGELQQQVRSGQLRVLATSGARREPTQPRIPTLRESGLDLSFVNWRGLLAPPGIGARRRHELVDLLRRLRATSGWEEALTARGWTDAALERGVFGTFLRHQDARVRPTMSELGLT